MAVRFPGFVRQVIEFLAGIKTNKIDEMTANNGVVVDGCLIKDGAVDRLASTGLFVSTEQTGTGSPQNIAHGLGVTPSRFWGSFTGLAGNAATIGAITASSTNLTVTVTAGEKYVLCALK